MVNNAGISFPGMIEWQTVEEMRKVVDVNIWGMVSITKAFLPLLKRTKGRVVNIASCLGRVAFPGAAAYCISKFGVLKHFLMLCAMKCGILESQFT